MKKRSPLTTFFEFSPAELRGILALVVIITSIAMYRYLPIFAPSVPPEIEFTSWGFFESADSQTTKGFKKNTQRRPWNLHPFNPNKTKAKQFREMGFSNQFISLFFAYRSEHGYVRNREEFFAIDHFEVDEKTRINPNLIFYWENNRTDKKRDKTDGIFQEVYVDVNIADSSQWSKLPGIGPVLSSRITRYRIRLGGFYSYQQLFEVYGLDSSLIEKLRPRLRHFDGVSKLPLNQLEADELWAHPYIDFKMAKRLVRYKEQHGKFEGIEDLSKVYGVEGPWLERISPYLEFN